MMTFKEWLSSVNGKFINVDNAYGAQCWDLAQDYLTRCLGGGSLQTGPSPHAGYAIGVWDGFGSNGLSQWFTQAPANATPKAGWVAIWKWGSIPFYPLSHIAIVVKDMPAGMVYCMTQNPGPAHYQPLAKAGLAGYLVPRKSPGEAGTTPNTPNAETVLDLPGAVTDAAANAIAVAGMVKELSGIAAYLSHPDNWKRIGLFILGSLMLLFAVVILLGKHNPAVNTAVKELVSK